MTGGSEHDFQQVVADIRRRTDEVWERIEAVGGTKETITLVAVTKTFPVELLQAAAASGLVDLGENYAQELAAKIDDVRLHESALRWHFIGGLQRNKVKLLAGKVALWHTVDRASLVTEIAKRSPGAKILVQVNTTGEAQKSGCEPSEVDGLVQQGREAGLDVQGLMTIGPTDASDPRRCFELLAKIGDRVEVAQLSMGMSADYQLAVECGSTMVRIGSALFGSRAK